MTFEKISNDLSMNIMNLQNAYDEISKPDKMKTINFYAHLKDIKSDPLTESQLSELKAICNILQILYTSSVGSPISDSAYDTLQEMLIDMGIPRLTGSVEINDNKKVAHSFMTLSGTLDKTYYLTKDEPRTNKSRKYLDEWIHSAELLYEKNTGNKINLNEVTVVVQPKFDGCSCVMEWDGKNALWITRGNTSSNLASDESIHMKRFNDIFAHGDPVGVKFEVMVPEESMDKINEFYSEHPYHNSRQIVTSIMNSNEPDFKEEYLYPVPLRIMKPEDDVEEIHPMLYEKFPTLTCKLKDRDKIREFANQNRYVKIPGGRLRTDGAVITILDKDIQRALGRDNFINNFEVAYKFTEEAAYSKVRNVEFYVSEFGYITPVLVVNDVILKGNTINHISLSNKERFDELGLCYGDTVKVLYDIIPYATIDANCIKQPNGRKIEFIHSCPKCHGPLNLNAVQVQCKNPNCPSRIVGKIMNYCSGLRIKNIGYQTIDTLYSAGLLPYGIRSLYKLRKKKNEIELIDGFGKLKTNRIVTEIEAKRKLYDYDFFGSIGIETLSKKTFKLIFANIPVDDFIKMIDLKNFTLLESKLIKIPGIGSQKAKAIISNYEKVEDRKELHKMLEEVHLISSFNSTSGNKGKIVFTGCRPNGELERKLTELGYDVSYSWSNSAKYLIVPNNEFTSSKVSKAKDRNVKIITINKIMEEL